MEKGILSCSCSISTLTSLATHIIFSGESNQNAIDSKPLGPVPQSDIDRIVATLTAHKHLFEARAPPEDDDFYTLLPGRSDFCCLFRVKVPVNLSLLSLQPLLLMRNVSLALKSGR
jgi:hypothetical protein